MRDQKQRTDIALGVFAAIILAGLALLSAALGVPTIESEIFTVPGDLQWPTP
jgi:hypothetical protein